RSVSDGLLRCRGEGCVATGPRIFLGSRSPLARGRVVRPSGLGTDCVFCGVRGAIVGTLFLARIPGIFARPAGGWAWHVAYHWRAVGGVWLECNRFAMGSDIDAARYCFLFS